MGPMGRFQGFEFGFRAEGLESQSLSMLRTSHRAIGLS